MSSDVDAMVQEAVQAYNAGNMDKAQSLLMEATELDDEHEQAWMWLSLVVEEEEDKRICLENVLSINPSNDGAKERLKALGKKDPSVLSLLADDEDDETDFEGVFESAFDDDIFDDADTVDEQGFELFAEDEFEDDDDDKESSLIAGPYGSSLLAEELDEDDEPQPISQPERAARPILSPMEATPALELSSPRGSSGPKREDDYFRLIPATIKATRVPGSDEHYPAWVVPGLALVVILNLLALVFLVINAG